MTATAATLQAFRVLTLLPALLALPACHSGSSSGSAPASPASVAEVGGQSVSPAELELEMRQLPPGPDVRDHALRQLLDRKRMVAEAMAAGLENEAATRRAMDGVLIRRLQEKSLQPQLDAVKVTEEEITKRFEAEKKNLTQPGSVTLAVLFLASNPADHVRREANRQQLTGLLDAAGKMAVGQGFGALAVENSQHQESRYRGGLLPAMPAGAAQEGWRAEILKACGELPPGGLSPIVETPDGLYLARVVERAAPREKSLAEVHDTLRRQALGQAETALRETFRAGLETRFPAALHQDVIEKVPVPAAPAATLTKTIGAGPGGP